MPATTKSAANVPPLSSFTVPSVDAARRVLEVENDTVPLMEGADEVAHLRTHDPLQWSFARRHDVNLDIPGAQGRGDLETDEAGAEHDGAARGLGALDDRPAVGERTQRVNVRLVGAGNGQADRFGSGREQ